MVLKQKISKIYLWEKINYNIVLLGKELLKLTHPMSKGIGKSSSNKIIN